MNDLRSFLYKVRSERPRDLLEVHRTVSPRYQTAAIVTKLEQSFRYPIVLFHDVAGCRFPVITNVCGSMPRLALALGCPIGQLAQTYADRCSHPVPPQLCADAPAQERVITKDEIDLHALPQLVYHENDSPHPYITAAIVVARDPETGRSNLSYHRLMVLNRNSTAIFMARGKHLDQIYSKYERAGQGMPVAAFLGVHPVCSLGAVFTGAAEMDEYDVIGGLQQLPLAVAQCITNTLQVPAHAEFVLEGVIPPRARIAEGPFGEFTGFSTGTACCPTFKVQAITSRAEPIFQDIVSGNMEHLLLPVLGMEHHLLQLARSVVPSVVSVRMTQPLTAYVSLHKTDDAQPARVIRALVESEIYVKQVVVVDAEVDAGDLRQVATAVALHVRPDRDIYIHPAMPGSELDPASESNDGASAKFGIDATQRLHSATRVRKNRVPQQLLDSVNLSDLLAS